MLQILKTSLSLPVKMQWAYSATSHGKGIIDGIGGRAKSLVKRAVMGKKGLIVQNATDFANVASSLLKDTKVILVDERDIAAVNDTGVWDDVEDFHGIRKAHIVLLEDGIAKCFKSYLERSEEICHVVLFAQKDEFMVDAEKELKTSQFVKVMFNTIKTERFFVGQVMSVDQLDVQVRFMRKKRDCVFVFPEKTDESFILKSDVCSILDCPIVDARGHYTFKHSIDAE